MAEIKLSGIPFIADKGYDSVKVIERVLEMGLEPYIKIRGSFRHGVKDELRLLSKRNVESGDGVYRKRYLVESLFGTIKSKLSSHIYAKREDMARKEALARMILWNIYILEEIRGYFSFLLFYRYLLKKYSKLGSNWTKRRYYGRYRQEIMVYI